MDIDNAIAQATKEVAAEQKASNTEAVTSETPEIKNEAETASTAAPTEKEGVAKVEEDVSKKPDSELTPDQLAKREKNRQSHLNSKLAQMRRENRELQAKISQTQQTPSQANDSANAKPQTKDFKSYDEYNDALINWQLDQKLSATNKKAEETQKSYEVDTAKARRVYEVANQEADFAKQNPDYAELVNDNQAFFSNFTPELAQGLSEADNASLALYALMREGAVHDLFDLSPTKLAAELARAEIRGESYLKQNKVSNAPRPITAVKGNTSSTNLADLSVEELMKKFKS